MSERRQSRLVPVANRAKRVKLGGALLTRYNQGGELRVRQSAQYPRSSLYGGARRAGARRGSGLVGDFVKDMILDSAAPAKYLSRFMGVANRLPKAFAALKGGRPYVNSGGAGGNPWVAHVKRVAKAQRIPYGEALSVASESYRGGRGAH